MKQIVTNATPHDARPLPAISKRFVLTGRIVSGLAIAFLTLDGVMKLVQPQPVIEATLGIGWPATTTTLVTLGLILLASTALYAYPRTTVLGAILLTGYLGGDPLFTHDLFGVYLGLFVWGGLWLRDARIRALIPIDGAG